MAAEAKETPARGKTVIRNIGLLLTGDIAAPLAEADTLLLQDGRIAALGAAGSLDLDGTDSTIDALGCAVCPGLIDSHCHPVFGA